MFHLFRASYVYKCIHVEISCRLGLNLAKSAQKPRLGNFPQWKLSRAKFPETFRKFSSLHWLRRDVGLRQDPRTTCCALVLPEPNKFVGDVAQQVGQLVRLVEFGHNYTVDLEVFIKLQATLKIVM
jgi:hypothetical protein